MYDVTAVPDFFLLFFLLSVFLWSQFDCAFCHEATKTLKLSEILRGNKSQLVPRCTANAEHLKSQKRLQPAGFA